MIWKESDRKSDFKKGKFWMLRFYRLSCWDEPKYQVFIIHIYCWHFFQELHFLFKIIKVEQKAVINDTEAMNLFWVAYWLMCF